MGSTLAPPEIGDITDKRLQALRAANNVRLGRAALLRRLGDRSSAASCRMGADIAADTPDLLLTLSAKGLLDRVRGMGPTAVPRMLRACGISPVLTLGAMTPRQHIALESALRSRAEFVSERVPGTAIRPVTAADRLGSSAEASA